MHHRVLGVLALAGLFATGLSGGARAEDAEKVPPAPPTASLEVRAYPVQALLRGHPTFTIDRGPYPAASDQVNDEQHPLYGADGDDWAGEFSSAADLVDRLKTEVDTGGAFEKAGVVLALVGESFLCLKGPRAIHEQVGAWLDQAGHRALRTVLLDVAAFRGEPTAADLPGGVPGAVASGAWVPLGVVRMVLSPQGGAAAREGAVRAYLQDWDVEVAEDSATADPIVGVAPEGLAVDVLCVPAPGDRMRVRLRGWWASPATWEQRATKDGDRIDVPTVGGAKLEADVELGGGTWTALPSSGGTVFAARLRVKDADAAAAPLPGRGGAPGRGAAPAGPLTLKSFDVRDLTVPIGYGRGVAAGPSPSNFTPPNPPELPEPAALVPGYALVDLLKGLAGPASWEREGASIALLAGAVVVRNDEATLAEIAALLDDLRARVQTTTTVRARIVSLPLSSLPEWWTGLPDELTREGGAALLGRPGAQVVDTASLRLREGQRLAALGGDRRTYVSDYDVEIAKNSAIGNPIVRSLLEGLSLDVVSDRLPGTPAVRLGLRVDRSRVLEMHAVPTRHGEIECPTLALARLRGEAIVPIGATRVLGAWGSKGEIRLLLVTASD